MAIFYRITRIKQIIKPIIKEEENKEKETHDTFTTPKKPNEPS
jgi:hypothetical protein